MSDTEAKQANNWQASPRPQRPIVGRIVMYQAPGYEGLPPAPAIVTAVHTQTCINATAFLDGRAPQPVSSLQHASCLLKADLHDHGYWFWPERQ